MLANQEVVKCVVNRLEELLSSVDGLSFDTYDVRVGKLYLYLSQHRKSDASLLLLKLLYLIELLMPLSYRHLRGIQKTWDPMGNSYRASHHLLFYLLDHNEEHRNNAQKILDRIIGCAVGESQNRGFALGFPCITGSNILWPTDVPVAHYSVRVGRSLCLWERIINDGRYTGMVSEIVSFLINKLPWVKKNGLLGVGYSPIDPLQVINIWADVASFLASSNVLSKDDERIHSLVQNVVLHQEKSGRWPYFSVWENKPGLEDNTHTAMVLGALADISIIYPDRWKDPLKPILERGVDAWINMFFDENSGRHWNSLDAIKHSYTVCLGDAIYAITRLTRSEVGLSSLTVSRLQMLQEKVIHWSIQNLKLKNGRFCERKLGFFQYGVESVRSFDGLVIHALSIYLLSVKDQQLSRNVWVV